MLTLVPPHPILPEPFVLPGVNSVTSNLVLRGDKLYAHGWLGKEMLLEIDPQARSVRGLPLSGKQPFSVHGAGEGLALYLFAKGKTSVATFDLATKKITSEMAVPRELEPECRRGGGTYGTGDAVFIPASGRFYVGFGCIPPEQPE